MPHITRRTFIKAGTALSVTSLLGGSIDGLPEQSRPAAADIDIAAVQGAEYFRNTIRAVELLGGMGKFVTRQAKVGLLIDASRDNPGSYVRPEIILAVVRMCREAGAKEVGVFTGFGSGYWQRSGLAGKYRDEIRAIVSIGGDYTEVAIPGGQSLKKAEVAGKLLDREVLINMPIAKDHAGLGFSGTMRNMMGLASFATNMFCHHGTGRLGWHDDADFLAQCIADINLVRQPTLCICDGTEILATNGPRGPGKIATPRTVFAGVDRLALDVYGANLLGRKGDGLPTVRLAHRHGLGEFNLSRLRIAEVTI